MIERYLQLQRKLNDLQDIDVLLATRRGIGIVTENAKSLAPSFDGELRQGIYDDANRTDYGAEGITYTNVAHGPYVELGTGPKGQANHDGISPNVSVAYTQSPWWIHESQIDQRVADHYHFFSIETESGKFYQCSGQAAHPFMYPALKNNVDNIVEEMGDVIEKQIRSKAK